MYSLDLSWCLLKSHRWQEIDSFLLAPPASLAPATEAQPHKDLNTSPVASPIAEEQPRQSKVASDSESQLLEESLENKPTALEKLGLHSQLGNHAGQPNPDGSVPQSLPDKGNLAILQAGGELKRAVTLETARRFGGVSRRAIEEAAKKGFLKTEGKRQRRRVLVTSLLEYFPPEK